MNLQVQHREPDSSKCKSRLELSLGVSLHGRGSIFLFSGILKGQRGSLVISRGPDLEKQQPVVLERQVGKNRYGFRREPSKQLGSRNRKKTTTYTREKTSKRGGLWPPQPLRDSPEVQEGCFPCFTPPPLQKQPKLFSARGLKKVRVFPGVMMGPCWDEFRDRGCLEEAHIPQSMRISSSDGTAIWSHTSIRDGHEEGFAAQQ